MNDEEYDKKGKEFEAELKPILTDEFLSTLVKAVQTCGWSVDYVESVDFVKWCFEVAGKEAPQLLTPFLDVS